MCVALGQEAKRSDTHRVLQLLGFGGDADVGMALARHDRCWGGVGVGMEVSRLDIGKVM